MFKGNFIEAELDADGALTIDVKSHGPDELRVGGSQMLDDVFDHFGADKIREFDAKWVRNSSFRGNYDEYMQNLQKPMQPEEAAWNTWTGRQLKGRGFTSVEVPAHSENPDVVAPVFKK
jgi:filamentous hemagglutinin